MGAFSGEDACSAGCLALRTQYVRRGCLGIRCFGRVPSCMFCLCCCDVVENGTRKQRYFANRLRVRSDDCHIQPARNDRMEFPSPTHRMVCRLCADPRLAFVKSQRAVGPIEIDARRALGKDLDPKHLRDPKADGR